MVNDLWEVGNTNSSDRRYLGHWKILESMQHGISKRTKLSSLEVDDRSSGDPEQRQVQSVTPSPHTGLCC